MASMTEEEEETALRERLAELLTQTANALKGDPPPLTMHDWSDLPEVALKLKRKHDEHLLQMGKANAEVARLEAELDEMRAKWAIAEEAGARHSKLSWDATQAADRVVTGLKKMKQRLEATRDEVAAGCGDPADPDESSRHGQLGVYWQVLRQIDELIADGQKLADPQSSVVEDGQ